MFCDICDASSYSSKTTIRITKDGSELLIQRCGRCGAYVETEYSKPGTKVSFQLDKSKTKRS
jgi:transcription elongation factor Elf1